MSAFKELPEFINGYRIIEDLGYKKDKSAKQKYRICIAECKYCFNHFQVRPLDLKKHIKCACIKRITVLMKVSTRLREIRKGMMDRCYNLNCDSYNRYGARGIDLCQEWYNYPYKFYEWSLMNGYQDNLTIDRIDNNKGYSPENCRWATDDEQMQNSSKAKLTSEIVLKIREEYKTSSYSILASKYNIHKSTIACIIKRKTWRNI